MVNSKPDSVETSRPARLLGVAALSPRPTLKRSQGLVLMGSLGLVGGSMAIADTAAVSASPGSGAEAPTASPAVVSPDSLGRQSHVSGSPRSSASVNLSVPTTAQPQFSPSPAALPAQTSPPHLSQSMQPPVPPPPAAAIVVPETTAAPTMAESLLQAAPSAPVVTPEPGSSLPRAADLVVPGSIAADDSVPAGYNSVFIDPTTYDVGATTAPAAPSVVFSNRATGCQITVAGGQPVSDCGNGSDTLPGVATTAGGALAPNGSLVGGSRLPSGPVTVAPRGVSLGSTVISRAALNDRIRPLNILRRGSEQFVFPLSIPAPISSVFGWRMHPVHQTWRFHAGTDIAAPMGTPVLATQAGRVAVADFLGGYGLTVILRHGDGNLESRYAHLSQISVRSGEWIEQGEVIGLVGSTGTSTGPHLHFEVRQLTGEGWVAMDPGEVLEYGLANLMNIINNPMAALGQAQPAADGDASALEGSIDYPYRPAQPNAS
ncbi:metalloendopeptidase [Leptolyngbya sp. BL0902]|uniref:M23 family metallopeptidase n=1 Tax=Leptolyngbya sp. BL0902 TaxID=1115757 RepID=UPI0019371E74|nr:M23 family metallopeptidase [Leptolyngbya sp. BL0902]QQE66246.1 metalloendopeptidase [Leptolyngbya sp. BL0902]